MIHSDIVLANVAEHSNMICSALPCNVSVMAEAPDLDAEHGRLEWARARAGYTSKAAFAKAVGVDATTYRAYENGQNGYAKYAAVFAKRLGVSAEWLLEGGPLPDAAIPPKPQLPDTIDKAPEQPQVLGEGAIQLKRVDLALSMGDGTNLDDYFEEEPFEFDATHLRTITHSPPHRVIIASGDGHSMMPTLLDGDMVAIDTADRTLNRMDKIWAVSVYGAGGIKRLNRVGPGKVEVISDNPIVDNRIVNEEDLHILGRVVWMGRRM